MSNAIDIAVKCFGIYSLILIIFGTIFNILGLVVCLRKRLRTYTTFVFFSFMFIADVLSLYLWCIDHFVEAFFNFVIEERSLIVCKLGTVFNNKIIMDIRIY